MVEASLLCNAASFQFQSIINEPPRLGLFWRFWLAIGSSPSRAWRLTLDGQCLRVLRDLIPRLLSWKHGLKVVVQDHFLLSFKRFRERPLSRLASRLARVVETCVDARTDHPTCVAAYLFSP